MHDAPNSGFNRDQMILRDWLALDRTALANKRTFLACSRTAIALVVLGIARVTLIDHLLLEVAGFGLMALGALIFLAGLREYRTNQNRLRRLLAAEKISIAAEPCADAPAAAHGRKAARLQGRPQLCIMFV